MQIATMSKVDRSKTDEVYVCGFVPCYILPKKMPWSLDPFLDPLITDIEDAFINGMYTHSFFMTKVYTCSSYWVDRNSSRLQGKNCGNRAWTCYHPLHHPLLDWRSSSTMQSWEVLAWWCTPM